MKKGILLLKGEGGAPDEGFNIYELDSLIPRGLLLNRRFAPPITQYRQPPERRPRRNTSHPEAGAAGHPGR